MPEARGFSVLLERILSGRGAFLLSFGCGALAALAFAPIYLLPLFALGLTGLLALLERRERPCGGFLIGWSFGFGHFAVGFYWITESFKAHPAMPDALGPPAVLLLAAGMAIYPGLVGWAHRKMRLSGFAALFGFATLWAAAEWLRGHLFTGFPWNPAAAIWTVSTVLMQPLALFGTYGLGAITAFIAASPALLVSPARPKRAAFAPLAGLLLIGLGAAGGSLRLASHPTLFVEDMTLRLVQPNIDQREKWDRDKEREHFARYLSLSQRLPWPGGHVLLVWPETAITDYFFDREIGRRALIARLLPPGAMLVSGVPRAVEGPDGRLLPANSVMAVASDGQIAGIYDKRHLVPFGEYLPARRILARFGLDALAAAGEDFIAGESLMTIAEPGFPAFTPLICYEIVFPGAVLPEDGARPDLLVNVTNDAWFGNSVGPYQHFAQARMRAVEEGLPIARAAGTGISGIIDPWGRMVRKIGLQTLGVIDSPLPRAAEKPFLARNRGLVFPALLALGCILTALAAYATERRNPGPASTRQAA